MYPSFEPTENPVPAGWSIHMTLAFVFQLLGLFTVVTPSEVRKQGPFSTSAASIPEQPGPPVIHKTTGSSAGSLRDSKNQKKSFLWVKLLGKTGPVSK